MCNECVTTKVEPDIGAARRWQCGMRVGHVDDAVFQLFTSGRESGASVSRQSTHGHTVCGPTK
eukprot:31090-Eustigmatos_ZCMA.PRE.1